MCWDYVYEEEHFDVNGYCSVGAISNGKNFLFFTVNCDEANGKEICRLYSSITFSAESLECQYYWTAENDNRLFECLNNLIDGNYCGQDSPVRKLLFTDSEE